MAEWPEVVDLLEQLQQSGMTGSKLVVAGRALDAASEWIADRCHLYVVDADGVVVVDEDDQPVRSTSIPAPVAQAILLYAAKFYTRKDSPTGLFGGPESGMVRTNRWDSDAEHLLEPYVSFGIA